MTSDLDGDGVPAAVVHTNEFWQHEDWDDHNASYALAFRDGRIVRYCAAEGLPIVGAIDADRDGRLDFVLRSPFVHDGGDADTVQAGPRLLAHTRADGSLTQNDAVAQAFAREECAWLPVRLVRRRLVLPANAADAGVAEYRVVAPSQGEPCVVAMRFEREGVAVEQLSGDASCECGANVTVDGFYRRRAIRVRARVSVRDGS